MNVTGRLIEVVEEFEGSSVKGDVAAGATTFPLADLGDFAEDGLCSILDAPYAFVVDEGAGTLVVDPPLAAAAEDGTPVYSLTWDSKRQSELVAVVDLLDDEAGVARAEVPVALRPMYPVGPSLAGALVDLATTESGYVVTGSPMRGLSIDAASVYNPFVSAYLSSDVSWPNDTYKAITTWGIARMEDVTHDAATGKFTIQTSGVYDVRCGVTFAAGGDVGVRAVRPQFETAAGNAPGRTVRIPGTGITGFETAQIKEFVAGESVYFEAYQNSGAALDMLGVLAGSVRTTATILRIVSA